MYGGGVRRSGRRNASGGDNPSSSSSSARNPPSFLFPQLAAATSSSSASSLPAPAPSPSPLFTHHPLTNYILTPSTPGIPVELRSRSQSQLDQLSSDVLLYSLHRHSALLPLRLSDLPTKVLPPSSTRGVGSTVLKDVRRRLRTLFGWRMEEVNKGSAAAADPSSSALPRKGRPPPRAASNGGKAAPSTPAADTFIITLDPAAHALDPALTADTAPPSSLSSARAQTALLKVVLDCVSWHHPDGVIAEDALLTRLAPLFGTTAAQLRLMSHHVLFGSLMHALQGWVECQYLEKVTLRGEDVDSMGRYGAEKEDSEQVHYKVGVRGKKEWGVERRYRWNVEEVMRGHASEEVIDRLRKKEGGGGGEGGGAGGGGGGDGKAQEEKEGGQVGEDEALAFALSQPAPRGRSSDVIALPSEQQSQLLSSVYQAMARYLLAHPCISERRLSSYYAQVKAQRNPPLEPLFSALNAALNWTALFVQRMPCEYTGEGMWMLVDRSAQGGGRGGGGVGGGWFGGYKEEEVEVVRLLLAELRRKEDVEGHAKLTLAQAHWVVRRGLRGAEGAVKGERLRRLMEGLDGLLARLAGDGWLYRHEKGVGPDSVGVGSYSVGMRGYVELVKGGGGGRGGAGEGVGGLGGVPQCPACRHGVWYGEWCGRHQEVDEGCRVKYHQHCVKKVRARLGIMKCTAGHVWGKEKMTEDEKEEMKGGRGDGEGEEEGEMGEGERKEEGKGEEGEEEEEAEEDVKPTRARRGRKRATTMLADEEEGEEGYAERGEDGGDGDERAGQAQGEEEEEYEVSRSQRRTSKRRRR